MKLSESINKKGKASTIIIKCYACQYVAKQSNSSSYFINTQNHLFTKKTLFIKYNFIYIKRD